MRSDDVDELPEILIEVLPTGGGFDEFVRFRDDYLRDIAARFGIPADVYVGAKLASMLVAAEAR